MTHSFPALWGRKGGVLQIQKDMLMFVVDEDPCQVFRLIPQETDIKMGGENSHHYFLSDRQNPGIVICVQDEAALSALASYGHPQAQTLLKKSSERRTLRALTISSPLVIALGLLMAIPALFAVVPIAWLNDVLTIEQEKKLGEFLYPSIEKEFHISKSHPAQPALEKLVLFLQEKSPELASYKFQISVAEKPEVNAFALPGAYIVVNEGLLQRAESIEEVLGVLSHELAHVQQRHVLKSVAGRLGSLGGMLVLSLFIGSEAASMIAYAENFLNLKYSRQDETDADIKGLQFLKNAGVSPKGMIHFFKKLEADENLLSSALPFLSTHPLSKERVEQLQLKSGSEKLENSTALPVQFQDLNPGQR
jgi:beta-barrel assembly-enhancing protease